jgi:outer membrane protein assembly factor BamC
MQTSWAENHAATALRGSQKWLGKWLGSVYTTGTRDQYNVRIEPGRVSGTSEVYLTHRAMIEKVTVDNGVDPVQTLWQPSPPNPDVEAEMLTLMMIDLGYTESQAISTMAASEAAPEMARIIQSAGGAPVLEMDDAMETAWRRVGLTLDRVSFMVEDRDVSNSVYLVRYADPEIEGKKDGFFSKWFSKDDAASADAIYRIQLTARGDKTEVAVLNNKGQPAPANVSKQIITLLYEQLR